MKVQMGTKKLDLDVKVKIGDKAPSFYIVDDSFQKFHLEEFTTDFIIISTYPSVDTSVCERQVVTFNKEASSLTSTVILNISCDLPFALKRFCGANDISNVKTFSDYNKHSFGKAFGLLIDEMQLLGRSIIILNKERKVVYMEVKEQIASQVDFDKALNTLKELQK